MILGLLLFNVVPSHKVRGTNEAGFLIGGAAGDYFSRRFPDYARPVINQLSQALGLPLSVLLYKGMPASSARATGIPGSADKYGAQYGILSFFIGAVCTWPLSTNAAIFAEVHNLSMKATVCILTADIS